MSFIHIKKIQSGTPSTGYGERYAVPSVAIMTPQGKKLIPNPSGGETSLFVTLEEAEEAVRRAGFDYVYEGKKTYTLNQNGGKGVPVTGGTSLESAIPVLIRHLQDREASVVANSAFALGTLKATESLEALSSLLGHDDPIVRKNVAEAMARIGPMAVHTLRDAFLAAQNNSRNNAPYIRLTVMTALAEMTQGGATSQAIEQFLPLALSALEDEHWLVRAQAALVVGQAALVAEEEKTRNGKNKTGY